VLAPVLHVPLGPPLAVLQEVDDVKELLSIAKEYVHALRIELARKAAADDPKRQAELAAYFTHCSLQPTHLRLSLQSAMSINYKLKNFNTAATFCRRLLELNPPPTVSGLKQRGLGCGVARGKTRKLAGGDELLLRRLFLSCVRSSIL
jgi:hypothetical protein